MVGSWSAQPKRRSQRVPLEMPVLIQRAGGRLEGRTVNVGLGGAFIDAPEPLVYDEQLELWLSGPGGELLGPVLSVVRWTKGSGFGVQFLELGAQDSYAIGELMRTAASEERLTLTHVEADLLLNATGSL